MGTSLFWRPGTKTASWRVDKTQIPFGNDKKTRGKGRLQGGVQGLAEIAFQVAEA